MASYYYENRRVRAARFRAFDADNPRVWKLFVWFTFMLQTHGCKRLSATTILGRVRYETAFFETTDTEYRINNNFSSYYARKFQLTYPEYATLFATRVSPADGMVSV